MCSFKWSPPTISYCFLSFVYLSKQVRLGMVYDRRNICCCTFASWLSIEILFICHKTTQLKCTIHFWRVCNLPYMHAIWHTNAYDPVMPSIMYGIQEGDLKTGVMPIKKKEWLWNILLLCKTLTQSIIKHIHKHHRSNTHFRGCIHVIFDLLPVMRACWSSSLVLSFALSNNSA